MYKLIRNLHLALGLVVTPFLLVYAVSAVFYSHHFLDFSSTETTVKEFKLISVSTNPIEIADLLSKKYNVRGTLRSSYLDDSRLMKLTISRPGNSYKIVVDTDTGNMTIEEKSRDAVGFIASLHEAGFRTKNADESWWSFAVTIVSVLLIFVVVTGIILWIYCTKDRLSGGVFLCASLVYCVTVLLVLYLD